MRNDKGSINSPPINIKKALEQFDNDIDFLKEITNDFVLKVEEDIIEIKNAITKKDIKLIDRVAHSIKGGAANIAADDLSIIASDLQKEVKNNNFDQCENLVKQISTMSKEIQNYNR